MKSYKFLIALLLAIALQVGTLSAADVALDYDAFKTRVEPIFLKKRPGHARCYVCHADSNNAFRLQKLSPGMGSSVPVQLLRFSHT